MSGAGESARPTGGGGASGAVDVSVVVPLLDEAATLEELAGRLRAVLEGRGLAFELVFVDDGSRDETPAILRRLEAEDARLRVFQLTRNFGQNAAVACGLFAARGDAVVTLDGDLQNPPEEVPKLLEALEKGADVATARRALRHERTARWLGSRAMHWLARALTGARIDDFGGQFKAYRRPVVEALRQAWAPGNPVFPLALWLGFPVAEVSVRHDPRPVGRSRYTLRSLLRINVELVTAFTTLPLTLVGLAGAVLLAGGAVGTLVVLAGDGPAGFAGAAALAALATGAVLVAAGVIGQYLARVYRIATGGQPGWVVRRGPAHEAAGGRGALE